MAALIGRNAATILVNTILLMLFVVYCLYTHIPHSATYFFVYSVIALLMLFTILIHPEYSSWYTHTQYGIRNQFLELGSGIWAFLIIGLYRDEERLLRDLKIIAALVFLAYITKFIGAMARGYWVVNGRRATYDMAFGFRILFCTAFWGAMGLLKDKRYLYLYFAGLLIILLGGSRGAFVWAVALPIANIPFRYSSMTSNQKKGTLLAVLLFIPFAIAILRYTDEILMLFASGLRRLGLSSRTILSMARGTMSEENGRDIIFRMARNLIKTGGPFGRGFYGDRITIGQRFYWGYSHDIFLELFVSFGYVGGTILSAALIIGCIKLYKSVFNSTRKVIFLTFFVNSLQLILSNSFWYESSFWALLALMAFWKREQRVIGSPVHDSAASSLLTR